MSKKKVIVEKKSMHKAVKAALDKYQDSLASELVDLGYKIFISNNDLFYTLRTIVDGSCIEIDLFSEDTHNNYTIGRIQFCLFKQNGAVLISPTNCTVNSDIAEVVLELNSFVQDVADDYIVRAEEELAEYIENEMPIIEYLTLSKIHDIITNESIEIPLFVIDTIRGVKKPLSTILNSPTLLSAVASTAIKYDFNK